MLHKFLASQGYEVSTAVSGRTALQSIIASPPDLLLLDLRLPEMSGVELLQTLRREHATLRFPVVVMSGVYRGEKYVEGARRLGVSHYLEKPFTPQLFHQTILTALAEHRSGPESLPVPCSIIRIYEGKKTGTLVTGNHAPISFIKGEPVSFVTRGRGEFASFLVGRGKISREEMDQFTTSGSERLYFTQTGLMAFDDLTEESRLFLIREVLDVLESDVDCAFTEGALDVELPLISLSVPRLYYDATKNRTSQVNPPAFLAHYGPQYPARTAGFYRLINLTTMGENDIRWLDRVDGRTPLVRIIPGNGDQREAVAFFNYLLTLGMVGFHPEPTTEALPEFPQKQIFNRPLEESPVDSDVSVDFDDLVLEVADSVILVPDDSMGAPLSEEEIGFEQSVRRDHAFIAGKNYYELFDLSPSTFSFNALKDAYFSKTRLYSPERFMELSGTTQAIAQEILSIYSSAYNTLSNVVAKERYDELLNADRIGLGGTKDEKLQAEIQFQTGNVFLEMDDYENAEKALQDAYTLEPDNALHCTYLAWAIYKNPANRNSRAAQDKARNLLGKALTIEKCPDAFTFRGLILLDEGRDGLAAGEFQKALKLNPRDLNAQKGLQQIIDKRESEKKGIFRKLFS
jgi:CheY-like chemotaxis protein/tetratricopeptide (TPR) repeat protein